MSEVLIVALLAFFVFLIYKFNDLNPSQKELSLDVVSDMFKNEINGHFGRQTVGHVGLTSQGFGFEGLDERESPKLTYLISASVFNGDQETCVYLMIDDLTTSGVNLATQHLIAKIHNLKKNLNMRC